MTIEELEKELEATRKALVETQEGAIQIATMCNRLIEVLIRVHGVLSVTDKSFIVGNISKEEYIKEQHTKQCNISNIFDQLFDAMSDETVKQDMEK